MTVEEGKTTEVLFTLLSRTSVIEGQIHVTADLLPEYIQIQAVFRTAQGTETHTVHARPDGKYRLDLLPAGKQDLQVTVFEQSGLQHRLEKRMLDIGAGQTLLLDFSIAE